MIAIFWKELRENAKWGALGLLLYALGLAFAWSSVTSANNYESYYGLLSPTIGIVTILGSVVIAGALGLLQIIPEQARDRWAFLVHRPVSWASIFWGKAAAGLLIYLLATLPAYLALALWISLPGHLPAPFDWRMAQSGIADILCGLICYFAALLTGLRKGRWWGSRALAIPGALLTLGIVASQWNFSASLFWIVPFTVAFAIAARAAFLSNGAYRPQGWPGRCALFVVIVMGTVVVVEFVTSIASMLARDNTYSTQVQYSVLKDGRPIARRYNDHGNVDAVVTLDGQPVPLSSAQLSNIYSHILPEMDLSLSGEPNRYGYRSPTLYFSSTGQVQNDLWFFVRRPRLYEVYERYTARHVGTLGENGFFNADQSAQVRPFHGKPSPWNIYSSQDTTPIFDSNVFALNLYERKVTKIAAGNDPAPPLTSAYVATDSEDSSKNFEHVAVARADGSITIYDVASARPLLTMPNHFDVRKWATAQLSALPDGSAYYIFRGRGNRTSLRFEEDVPTQFEQYDSRGTLVAQQTLPAPPAYVSSVNAWAFINGATSVPVVVAYNMWKYPEYSISPARRVLLITMTVACLLAAALGLMRMRGQQMSVRARVIWTLAILVTGIPGLLAFIGTREMTARVACPSCSSPRLIDRETCPKCNAVWPAPKTDGSEIFPSPAAEKDLAAIA